MTSEPPTYADRVYRSPAAVVAGVLLCGLAAWLGGDALLRGDGRTPVSAAAALLLVVPLFVAFTFRPAVYANDDRVRVRNPFRTISAPWTAVDDVRATYSTELLAGGRKYQMWAIPVSLRQRSRATRHNEDVAAGRKPRVGPFGLGSVGPADDRPRNAPGDAAVNELRELRAAAHRNERVPEGERRGEVAVRWCWEVLAPMAVGAVGLLVLWAL
jgi:hypothetical protein